MGQFFEWVIDPKNINANIFTLLSVVLSGLVSWIISAAYFSIGNRNTLKSAILHPMRRLLEQPPSWSNYRTLTELTKEHSIKYLQKASVLYSTNYCLPMKMFVDITMRLSALRVCLHISRIS